MEQIKVSVIIPVYNAEAYLEQCLDSLVKQSLRDIEIICVDDGSTDGSPSILEKYAAKDTRIRTLWQKNQFAGVARNNGMAVAEGEYLIFLDADDFFDPRLLELLYEQGKSYGADVVLCGADRYDEPSRTHLPMSWFLNSCYAKEQPTNRHKIPDKIFQLTSLAPWNKMFSAQFVRDKGLRFQSLPRANDVYFSMVSLALAERIAVVDEVLVHYRVGMSTNLQAKNHLTPLAFCEALEAVYDRLQQEGIFDSVQISFSQNALSQMVYNLKKLVNSPEAYKILSERIETKYLRMFGLTEGIRDKKLNANFSRELMELLDNPPRIPLRCGEIPAQEESGIPCVSVIIPVYNVENYLAECLDSVINQTLKNIEIICVNDGSTDMSAVIMEAYQKKDKRIRILKQNNVGVSAARDCGFQVANGEYIYYLDSDDVLEREALETLYEVCKTNRLDALYFDFVRFCDDGTPAKAFVRDPHEEIYDGASFYVTLQGKKQYTSVVWGQLIDHNFLKKSGIRFYPGIIHEDDLYTFQILMNAQRVSHISKKLYRHRVRDNSIMTKPKGPQNLYGYFTCLKEIMFYGMQADYGRKKNAAIRRAFQGMHWQVKHIYNLLTAEEKASIRFDDALSMSLFQALVIDFVKLSASRGEKAPALVLPLNESKEQAQAIIIGELQQEIENIRASVTYKVGRFLTWLPRMIRKTVYCYRDNGLQYTLQRILVHLRLRKDAEKYIPAIPKNVDAGQTSVQSEAKSETKKPIKRDYKYYCSLPKEKYEEELIAWYYRVMGKQLSLDNPQTLNEKIQWLKLYDSTPLKTRLADKYLVREWIEEKIGGKYLVPLLGVWNQFDEIDFGKLPDRFALKTTHGSGWNVIVNDKSSLDISEAKNKFDTWMKKNFAFACGFEMHYMNIQPRIIAEEFIENAEGLIDYRFYCFNGKPEQVWVDIFSGTPKHLRSIFDMDWNLLPIKCTWPDGSSVLGKKPKHFEKMAEIAKQLSKDFAFVRVDFFEVEGKLYIGELTFTPMSGKGVFEPEEWDLKLGNLLTLPPPSPIPDKLY